MKKMFFIIIIFLLILNLQLFCEENETIKENKNESGNYNLGLEFTIGMGTALEFNFDIQKRLNSGLQFDKIPNETFYDFDFFQLNIPFSLLFNLNKNCLSFGFSFIYGLYNFSYSKTISSTKDNTGNYGYSLNQSINLNFKFKIGNFSKYVKFVSELGFVFEYYYEYSFTNNLEEMFTKTDYNHFHNYDLFIGPRLSCGFEVLYNHFSFEFGSYVGYLRGAGYLYDNDTDDKYDFWINGNKEQTDIYNRIYFGFYLSCNFSYFKKIR